ncbi:MAG: SDR family NAD(P)-dependent oxidoreductase [Promethearchaeia archaeon]
MNEKRFEGKVVFVSGGSSGLGKRTAKDFAKEGTKVILFDKDAENGNKVQKEITKEGGEAIYIEGDVREKSSVEDGVEKAFQKFGTVDFLINSAGILQDGMIHKLPEEKWNNVIDTNLKGCFLCLQACATRWIKAAKAEKKEEIKDYPDKRVVSISSQAAEGNIGQINYSASKAGLIGMTKTAAMELIRYNVKVHSVMPTLIDTPILGELLSKQDGKWRKYYSDRIPLGIGQPKHVSDAIRFLCSEESSFTTGIVLPVNGGRLGKL